MTLTFGLYAGLIALGAGEDPAKSVFWQLGLFPTSFLGCWWAFLFARGQLDAGGELIFVFEKHPLVKFGLAYSLLYTTMLFLAAGMASIAIPDRATFLLLQALLFSVRGFFFSSLFLVVLSLTKSSSTGLLVSFSYSAISYFTLIRVLPVMASVLPAQIPATLTGAISLYAGLAVYALVGLAVTFRAERGYFG